MKNMKNMKNMKWKGINSRLDDVEWISYLKDRVGEVIQLAQQKEKIIKNYNLRDLWDNSKYNNVCIIRIPKEERERGIENLVEETIAENFTIMAKKVDIQI